MTTMTINEFVTSVRADNTIFGVTFTKKGDGSLRNMTCRMGVSKGVTGAIAPGVRRDEDDRNNVLTVFDMNVIEKTGSEKGAFRRINLDQVHRVALHGFTYLWNTETRRLERVTGDNIPTKGFQ
jgi:hypothetical protein